MLVSGKASLDVQTTRGQTAVPSYHISCCSCDSLLDQVELCSSASSRLRQWLQQRAAPRRLTVDTQSPPASPGARHRPALHLQRRGVVPSPILSPSYSHLSHSESSVCSPNERSPVYSPRGSPGCLPLNHPASGQPRRAVPVVGLQLDVQQQVAGSPRIARGTPRTVRAASRAVYTDSHTAAWTESAMLHRLGDLKQPRAARQSQSLATLLLQQQRVE